MISERFVRPSTAWSPRRPVGWQRLPETDRADRGCQREPARVLRRPEPGPMPLIGSLRDQTRYLVTVFWMGRELFFLDLHLGVGVS